MSFAKDTSRWPKRCAVIIDGILKRPDAARQWALQQEYYRPDHATGWRSAESKVFPGTLSALKRHFGHRISLLSPRLYDASGVTFFSFSNGRRQEVPGVHWDEPVNAYIVLIYLTPNLPPDCGTSLWQHKRTGLMRAPVRADERRLHARCEDVAAELEDDSTNRTRWVEIDRLGYRYNRGLVYPAYALHSATRHYGSSMKNGRIYQLLGFRVS